MIFVDVDNFVKWCFDGGLLKDRELNLTLENLLEAADMSIQKLDGSSTADPVISRLIAGWTDWVFGILAHESLLGRREVVLFIDALDELESVHSAP